MPQKLKMPRNHKHASGRANQLNPSQPRPPPRPRNLPFGRPANTSDASCAITGARQPSTPPSSNARCPWPASASSGSCPRGRARGPARASSASPCWPRRLAIGCGGCCRNKWHLTRWRLERRIARRPRCSPSVVIATRIRGRTWRGLRTRSSGRSTSSAGTVMARANTESSRSRPGP